MITRGHFMTLCGMIVSHAIAGIDLEAGHKKTRQVGGTWLAFFGGQMVLGRPAEHMGTWPVGCRTLLGTTMSGPASYEGGAYRLACCVRQKRL
ncbi:hypothetical protein TH25_19035 [Thalassospira profundimaris]|uniref:Uncharacterized protein n=1 Tax=Thalassospira profundimaris TaxID=502049 RepID=A0A367WW82_9PROT|nr:hypothetical protein TH25_19035 [Thalassospira profundimaris]